MRKKKMNFINIIPVLFTLLLPACSATSPEKASHQKALLHIEKEWKLIAIDGRTVDANITSTLHLDSKLKASGILGCNRFWANAELKDHKLIIKQMATTRKMCNKKANNVEKKVIDVFSNWSQMQVSQAKLTITGKTHKLTYKADIIPNQKSITIN